MASLVYHSGALGDFITTLPALELWKRAHPAEPLVLLGKPEHGALVPRLFHQTWDAVSARVAPLFSADGAGPAVKKLLNEVSSALVFARESSPLFRVLSSCGFSELVRQDPFPASDSLHVVDYHLELFAGHVRDEDRVPRIPVQRSGTTRGPAVAPGSGSTRKNWPLDRFQALCVTLAARGHPPVWITGPAEDGDPPSCATESWRSLPLTELVQRLAACRVFVGNDSGVSHLAAAAGCPTVALFGVTSERVWAPRGPRVTVVRSLTGRIQDISTEEVLEAVESCLGESR